MSGRCGLRNIIIVGQPKWIVLKLSIQEIFVVMVVGVNDGLFAIGFLHNSAPDFKVFDQFRVGLTPWYPFNIKDWRQVTGLQFYIFQEIIGLTYRIFIGAVKVIGTTNEVMLFGHQPVLIKMLISTAVSHCGPKHCKPDRNSSVAYT